MLLVIFPTISKFYVISRLHILIHHQTILLFYQISGSESYICTRLNSTIGQLIGQMFKSVSDYFYGFIEWLGVFQKLQKTMSSNSEFLSRKKLSCFLTDEQKFCVVNIRHTFLYSSENKVLRMSLTKPFSCYYHYISKYML